MFYRLYGGDLIASIELGEELLNLARVQYFGIDNIEERSQRVANFTEVCFLMIKILYIKQYHLMQFVFTAMKCKMKIFEFLKKILKFLFSFLNSSICSIDTKLFLKNLNIWTVI